MIKLSKLKIEKDLDRYKKARIEKEVKISFKKKDWEFWRDILVVGDCYKSNNIDRQLDAILNI